MPSKRGMYVERVQSRSKSPHWRRNANLSASGIRLGLLERERVMDRSATRRRHVRDKSVIDHVARDLFKPPPEPAAEKSDKPKPTTDTGLSVEEQVRKEWDPSKGGLPTFLA